MKAAQYKVNNCILDKEDNIHVLLTNSDLGVFVPMYVSLDQGQLLMMPKDEIPDEINYFLFFVVETWTSLGYTIKSIIIDHQGSKGSLL